MTAVSTVSATSVVPVDVEIVASRFLMQADSSGATALVVAAEHGHVETVRALLAAGADVNQARVRGLPAKSSLCPWAHLAFLSEVMLLVGTQFSCLSLVAEGRSDSLAHGCQQWARRGSASPVEGRCRCWVGMYTPSWSHEHYAKWMMWSKREVEVLVQACSVHCAMSLTLLSPWIGLDPNHHFGQMNGWSPLRVAREKGHAGIVALLTEAGATA